MGGTIVYAYAVDVPSDASENEWITGNLEGCSPRFEDAQPVSVDGHPGRIFIREICDDTAFVFIDARVYVFAARPNQKALLHSFLSTVEFRP